MLKQAIQKVVDRSNLTEKEMEQEIANNKKKDE